MQESCISSALITSKKTANLQVSKSYSQSSSGSLLEECYVFLLYGHLYFYYLRIFNITVESIPRSGSGFGSFFLEALPLEKNPFRIYSLSVAPLLLFSILSSVPYAPLPVTVIFYCVSNHSQISGNLKEQ